MHFKSFGIFIALLSGPIEAQQAQVPAQITRSGNNTAEIQMSPDTQRLVDAFADALKKNAATAPTVVPTLQWQPSGTTQSDSLQSVIDLYSKDDWQVYRPKVTTPDIITGAGAIQLRQLESGSVISFETLNQRLQPDVLQGLALGGIAELDLSQLGITGQPSVPVNSFALYNEDGSFSGIGTALPGMSSEDYIQTTRMKGKRARPVSTRVGDREISTLSHKILTALSQVCASKIRPVEMTFKATGGWNLGFEASAEITAKIDVNRSCELLEQDFAVDVADAN